MFDQDIVCNWLYRLLDMHFGLLRAKPLSRSVRNACASLGVYSLNTVPTLTLLVQ